MICWNPTFFSSLEIRILTIILRKQDKFGSGKTLVYNSDPFNLSQFVKVSFVRNSKMYFFIYFTIVDRLMVKLTNKRTDGPAHRDALAQLAMTLQKHLTS